MPYKSTEKQRIAQRKWKQKRLEEIKKLKDKPCVDCGGKFHPVCMQFDHLPEKEKKFKDISKMVNYKMDRILEEIEKCDLVCANCHALRTYYRQINAV